MDMESIYSGLQSNDFNLDEDSFGARGLRERYVYDGRGKGHECWATLI